MKVKILHTGKVYVSNSLPFKDKEKNPNPVQLSLTSLYDGSCKWIEVSQVSKAYNRES